MKSIFKLINSIKASIKNHIWPLMLFVMLGFLFLIIIQQPDRQLFGHDVSLQGDGINFMKDEIRTGHLPYWNPYINAGMPHMASMNANIVFFPSALIILLLGLPLNMHFLYECFTAIVLAGFFMYLFIHSLGLSKLTGCIAGVFFLLCGSFFTYINPGHDPIMLALAFLPITLYFINKGIKEDQLKYYLYAGAFLGIQSLACMYQMTFYTAIYMTVYFIFMYFFSGKKSVHILYFLATGVVTVSTGAIQLFQSFYFLKYTFRAAVTYDFFTSWSFHPTEMIVYLYPKFFGFLESTYWGKSPFWLHNDYLGIIPLVLALSGVIFMFKDRRVKFFLITAACLMILAFGGFTPLYKLLYKIPVINGFRNSTRWLGFFAFSIITLSAFGFEYIINYYNGKKDTQEAKKVNKLIKVLLIVGAAALLIYLYFSSTQDGMINNLKGLEQFNKRFPAQSLDNAAQLIYRMIKDDMLLFVIYFSIGLSLMVLTLKGKIGKGLFFTGCFLMVFIDNGVRFMAPETFNTGTIQYTLQCVKTEPSNMKDPRRVEIQNYLSNDKSLYRVMPVGDLFNKNWFISDRIQSCGGYHSAPLENFNYINSKGMMNDFRYLGLLNAKYILTENPINHPYLRLVSDGKVKIYQNTAVLPRAFLSSKVEVFDKEKMLARMQEQSFDPKTAILLNESVNEPLDNIMHTEKEVKITKFEANKIELETDSTGNSMLFLSEVYYPEWKAYVDGKEAKIYQSYGLFRSIFMPKGKHIVEFKWDSKIFRLGAAITLITLILILIYTLYLAGRTEEQVKS